MGPQGGKAESVPAPAPKKDSDFMKPLPMRSAPQKKDEKDKNFAPGGGNGASHEGPYDFNDPSQGGARPGQPDPSRFPLGQPHQPQHPPFGPFGQAGPQTPPPYTVRPGQPQPTGWGYASAAPIEDDEPRFVMKPAIPRGQQPGFQYDHGWVDMEPFHGPMGWGVYMESMSEDGVIEFYPCQ